ncbi:aggregation-promoting factor C-terminal-like domain-containing protein [Cellulomonas edaphi]|uniref:Ubiquitin-like domain-containing protein n=1 Tax=Cellulomonas edaphi TaxID=3053468 RepID=A0ABT7S4Z4_9CELL|nr:ubiquitin-like domain-containing protein [Cellulomons edaphi]MDM7830661.1 ubiquitin-like domain-containing protein [Cellulomons edaphi]
MRDGEQGAGTRTAARRRRRGTLVAQAAVLAVVAGATSAFAVMHKQVTVDVDGRLVQVEGFGRTVGSVLAGAEIEVGAGDLVAPSLHDSVTQGEQIVVRHGRNLELVVDGEPQTVWTTALTVGEAVEGMGLRDGDVRLSASRSAPLGREALRVSTQKTIHLVVDGQIIDGVSSAPTVRDALKDIGLVLNEGDEVSVPLDATAVDGLAVLVTRAQTDAETRTEAVKFATEEIEDPGLAKGTKVIVTKGKAGIRTTTYQLDSVGGVVTGRQALSSVVTTKPVTQVVHVGTMVLPDPTDIKVAPGSAQEIARGLAAARGWGDDQFACLVPLWTHESGWRVNAENRSSGAYGIPQALPGTKMASVGADWRTNPVTQITWGLNYIKSRYKTPCGAWSSFQAQGWY